MRDKPTRGERRIQMLRDLANDNGSVAALGSKGQRRMEAQRKYVKTCSTADY